MITYYCVHGYMLRRKMALKFQFPLYLKINLNFQSCCRNSSWKIATFLLLPASQNNATYRLTFRYKVTLNDGILLFIVVVVKEHLYEIIVDEICNVVPIGKYHVAVRKKHFIPLTKSLHVLFMAHTVTKIF